MTLSRWLRDYLYIPLGGSRGKRPILTYRNLMLTMLLGGLWHGAAWTFVVWGALHGVGLVRERWRQDAARATAARPQTTLARAGARGSSRSTSSASPGSSSAPTRSTTPGR